MKDPTQLMMAIAQRTLELKVESSGGPCSFRDGVKLFINPQSRCPDCEDLVYTNRVWLIDDKNKKLIRCWDMKGKHLIQDPMSDNLIVHPHVTCAGSVCLGNTVRASVAMFTSVSKGRHYYDTEMWFQQLGHDCPKLEKIRCLLCNILFPQMSCRPYGAYSKDYLLCSRDCHNVAHAFRCIKCFAIRDFYDHVEDSGLLCPSCYQEETLQCDFCEGRVFQASVRKTEAGLIVCLNCRANHKGKCFCCERELFHKELYEWDDEGALCCKNCDRDEDGICTFSLCRQKRDQSMCPGCERWFRNRLLDDSGLCSDCRTPVYTCYNCDNEVDEEGDLCSSCTCRVDGCEEVINRDESNRYCPEHIWECGCVCGCGGRVEDEGDICSDCEFYCDQEPEEEYEEEEEEEEPQPQPPPF